MRYIFGPVSSRRFGKSLGINVVPYKICSYDCIYCEVGKTTKKIIEQKPYVVVDELIEEFKESYNKYRGYIDVITITGQGEPTLNNQLGEIIEKIESLSTTPILILTNGSLLFIDEVRLTLSKTNMVCTSLDAVSPEIFYKINNPALGINISHIINGLIEFSMFYSGKLFIEVLLVKGINDNIDHIDEIIRVIKKCKYHLVQINTVYRPPSYTFAEPLDETKILEIENYMEDRGVKINKASRNYNKSLVNDELLEEYILSTTALRPLCVDEIIKIYNVSTFKIDKIMQDLILNEKLLVLKYGDKNYYIKSSNRRV